MRRYKRTLNTDLTKDEIAHRARLARKLLKISDRSTINILELIARLRSIFPRLKTRIVPDVDLGGAEARAYPEQWLIKFGMGIREGLLRSDRGARWTIAHELGHVLLKHPGRPFRNRSSDRNAVMERQADIFAAEFLAPTALAIECQSADAIRQRFGLSPQAARRRFAEIELLRKSHLELDSIGLEKTAEILGFEDLATIICAAITQTTTESCCSVDLPVEPMRNSLFSASTSTAKAAQILVDAYQSVRGSTSCNKFICAATLAAAIITMRPIREIGETASSRTLLLSLNRACALRAAISYLGIDPKKLDGVLTSKREAFDAVSFGNDYMSQFLQNVELAIDGSATTLYFADFITYQEYNGLVDISWSEITSIENIASLLEIIVSCAD